MSAISSKRRDGGSSSNSVPAASSSSASSVNPSSNPSHHRSRSRTAKRGEEEDVKEEFVFVPSPFDRLSELSSLPSTSERRRAFSRLFGLFEAPNADLVCIENLAIDDAFAHFNFAQENGFNSEQLKIFYDLMLQVRDQAASTARKSLSGERPFSLGESEAAKKRAFDFLRGALLSNCSVRNPAAAPSLPTPLRTELYLPAAQFAALREKGYQLQQIAHLFFAATFAANAAFTRPNAAAGSTSASRPHSATRVRFPFAFGDSRLEAGAGAAEGPSAAALADKEEKSGSAQNHAPSALKRSSIAANSQGDKKGEKTANVKGGPGAHSKRVEIIEPGEAEKEAQRGANEKGRGSVLGFGSTANAAAQPALPPLPPTLPPLAVHHFSRYFSPNQIKAIMEYALNGVFAHWRLYAAVFSHFPAFSLSYLNSLSVSPPSSYSAAPPKSERISRFLPRRLRVRRRELLESPVLDAIFLAPISDAIDIKAEEKRVAELTEKWKQEKSKEKAEETKDSNFSHKEEGGQSAVAPPSAAAAAEFESSSALDAASSSLTLAQLLDESTFAPAAPFNAAGAEEANKIVEAQLGKVRAKLLSLLKENEKRWESKLSAFEAKLQKGKGAATNAQPATAVYEKKNRTEK